MADKHWRVVVFIDGEEVLAIEPYAYGGIAGVSEHRKEIIEAANNLLAFIGNDDGHGNDFLESPHETI